VIAPFYLLRAAVLAAWRHRQVTVIRRFT